MSKLNVNAIEPSTGTDITLGASGDTTTVPSGATFDISASTLTPPATMPASSGVNFTALNATNLGSGTVAIARGGTGAATFAAAGLANSSYFLAAENTEFAVGTSLTLITIAQVLDDGGVYDPATGKFVAPSDGRYFFTFTGTFRSTSNDQTGNGFSFYKNGSSDPYTWSSSNFTGHRNDVRSYSYIFDLSASDYIQCYGYVTGSATTSVERPTFMGFKLIG